jgi:hypothetical protein
MKTNIGTYPNPPVLKKTNSIFTDILNSTDLRQYWERRTNNNCTASSGHIRSGEQAGLITATRQRRTRNLTVLIITHRLNKGLGKCRRGGNIIDNGNWSRSSRVLGNQEQRGATIYWRWSRRLGRRGRCWA